jgi:hypothetical protein
MSAAEGESHGGEMEELKYLYSLFSYDAMSNKTPYFTRAAAVTVCSYHARSTTHSSVSENGHGMQKWSGRSRT